MKNRRRGFSYTVSRRQIEEYRTWPVERRLRWLFLGNKLRQSLPKEKVAIQEAFRRGEM
jgi:hypothetical protein